MAEMEPDRRAASEPDCMFYENIDSREFAKRLGLSLTWVQNHTRRDCADLIPHVKLGAKVVFEWGSPELYAWWHNHRKRNTSPVTRREPGPAPRIVARPVLRGSSERERQRGARMAADVIRSRTAERLPEAV